MNEDLHWTYKYSMSTDGVDVRCRPATRSQLHASHAQIKARDVPMALGNAAIKAMNTVEILERILFQLPPQHIFINQRVCSTWRDLINKSPDLQCAIFYRYSAGPPKHPITINPLLDRLLDCCYECEVWCRDCIRQGLAGYHERFRCNYASHIFVRESPPDSVFDFSKLQSPGWTPDPYDCTIEEADALSDTSKLQPASWQKMLLSDQPVHFFFAGRKYAYRRLCRKFEVRTTLELVEDLARWQADRIKFWIAERQREPDSDGFVGETITTFDESSDQYSSNNEDEVG